MIPAHLQNRTLDQLRQTQETIRCFLIQPIGEGYESVVTTEDGQCIAGFSYHRSEKVVRRFQLESEAKYPKDWLSDREELALPYCSRCGNFNFTDKARTSGSKGRVWERVDTGERADNINDFGVGAMWYVTWYDRSDTICSCCGVVLSKETANQFEWNEEAHRQYHRCGTRTSPTFDKHLGYWHSGFDTIMPEPPLCVRTPGGDWVIDSRASNCTRPDDQTHRCWVRHGVAPNITVDKNGDTCHAGGGSILFSNWHGFLREGFLVKC